MKKRDLTMRESSPRVHLYSLYLSVNDGTLEMDTIILDSCHLEESHCVFHSDSLLLGPPSSFCIVIISTLSLDLWNADFHDGASDPSLRGLVFRPIRNYDRICC